jgi:DNA-binding response OmpR family regulator
LRDPPWHISVVGGCAEAIAHLTQQQVSIVLCDGELPAGSWREILGHVALSPEPPILIVASRLADDFLWAEVLNLGGYDVLSKPFNDQEVRRVIGAAWLRRGNAARVWDSPR